MSKKQDNPRVCLLSDKQISLILHMIKLNESLPLHWIGQKDYDELKEYLMNQKKQYSGEPANR